MKTFDNLRSIHLLPSGKEMTLRLLDSSDARALGEYLTNLSAETRRRFGPHALDQATADQICSSLNPMEILRLVAIIREQEKERIVAYVILQRGVTIHEERRYREQGHLLLSQADCTLAPSVADEFQNQKLGSLVLKQTLILARQLGHRYMVLLGGTQATNERAVHFYKKHGFMFIGEFEYPAGVNNFDMMCVL